MSHSSWMSARTLPCLALLALVVSSCLPGSADDSEASDARKGRGLADLAETAGERRLSAGFLIVDGVYNTELTAPWDVFQHTLHHAPDGLGIEVFTVSPDGNRVTTAEGLEIVPEYSFETAPAVDILVVPSAEGSRDADLERADVIRWVREAGARAGAVMSLCWGAFVLAEAGLLDNEACTTFPSDYGTFAQRFPKLDLRVNVSFVHSGSTLTSQGGVRSFDAAMYLVDAVYGTQVARAIGKGLLVTWPPEAGSVAYLATANR